MSAPEGNRLRQGLVVAGILDIDRHPNATTNPVGPQGEEKSPTNKGALSLWDRMLEALDMELEAKLAGDDTATGDTATEDGDAALPPRRAPDEDARGDKHGRHER